MALEVVALVQRKLDPSVARTKQPKGALESRLDTLKGLKPGELEARDPSQVAPQWPEEPGPRTPEPTHQQPHRGCEGVWSQCGCTWSSHGKAVPEPWGVK